MSVLAERIERYLDDDAVTLVDHYVNSDCFTGRAFATLDTGSGNPSDQVTADDLLAVAMLAIPVRRSKSSRFAGITPEQALTVISSLHVRELLTAIPSDVHLHQLDAERAAQHVGQNSPAGRLYSWLRGDVGLKPTATFKLLARKRPRLLPVSDTQVRGALDTGDAWWMPMWEALHAAPELVDRVRAVGSRAHASQLSVLRIIDVAVWMRVKGTAQCPCPLPTAHPA